MASLFRELTFAFRQLRKSPGFTVTAVLTLAIAIGATTAIFSIVEGVLLRPLPFAAPGGLMTLGDTLEGAGIDVLAAPAVTAPEAVTYASELKSFSSLGAYQQTVYEFSGAGDPAQIDAARLTAGVFKTLGVRPLLGRPFSEQEDQGRQRVVVVSYQMWRERFGSDPHVLGRKILLDRKPYDIVGVMPREFEFPLVPGQLNRSELWVPMSFAPASPADMGSWNYQMVGRLKPGVTPQQAQSEAARVAQEIMRGFPAPMASLRIHPVVQRLDQSTVAEAVPLVRTLFFAVLVVLLIACANLAGLLLLRVIRRRREIAVRIALGASRATVVSQMLMETFLLAAAGGLLGLALASEALHLGIVFLPASLPRISSIELDWPVIAFASVLALSTVLLCGLLPAMAASRTDVNDSLKEGGRTGSAGGGHARLRAALVVTELAVALVLLTASGLLLRSFEKLRAVDLGLRTDHVLTAGYQLPKEQYATQTAVDGFNKSLLMKLQRLPGIETAGITSTLPAAGLINSGSFVVEGRIAPKGEGITAAWPSAVLGSYFGAAGIPILRGRDFTEADRQGSPLVAIVNRTLAERYWPHQNPIGKRLHFGLQETPLPWMTVVGEIGDVKQSTADTATRNQIYQPANQSKDSYGMLAPPDSLNANFGFVVLRTALQPEKMKDALRTVVRSIDSQLPLTQVESMEHVVEEGQAPRRFNAALISSFAGAAVFMALLGIYSVISFSAALRTQEMAIRLALGSTRERVVGLILTSGVRLGLLGCGIGLVASVLTTRLLRSLLFQVDALDTTVLGVAAILLFGMAMAASVIPACRAAGTDPVQALHSE